MASIVRNLIEYSGIADILPIAPVNFKQLSVQETVCLPIAKPDIEQIVKIIVQASITSTRVIVTPIGTSAEGQKLTGFKLVVEGSMLQKIEYVADEPTQSVHAAHFDIPFSTFIVLPATFVIGSRVQVDAYIEDVFAQQTSKRCIFKNITLLLDAVIG